MNCPHCNRREACRDDPRYLEALPLSCVAEFSAREDFPHDYEQIPALVERSKLRVKNFFADLDERLAEVPFVAGARYSAADITALVTVDFAKALELSVAGYQAALARWYEAVSGRTSAAA